MHIESTSHEHGLSGKVYTYEADFDVSGDAITWHARVCHPEESPRVLAGTIPITSPAVAALADKAVRDAIVQGIDTQRTATTDESALRTAPVRTPLHDALQVFVGQWRAEGLSYGGAGRSDNAAEAAAQPWKSTQTAQWHEGRFFLLHDEKGHAGDLVHDTLSVLGVDAASGQLVAHCYDNRGVERRYDVQVDGARWRFSAADRRGNLEFSADGRSQRIHWEWRPRERWLPLREGTARRVD